MCFIRKPAGCKIGGFFLCLFFIFNSSCFANDHPEPFLTRNESPFSLVFGLPLASSAQLLENRKSRWISSLNISNTLNAQSGNQQQLLIDVETWNANFLYDYAFAQNWMLRLQLPYIAHSGGILDSAIDSYHQAFGLPENIRPLFPLDQIDINVSLNNQTAVNINSDQSAIGDISLQLAWQAQNTEQSSLSYWVSLKLPTGDENSLTGSGATDIASWASMDYKLSKTRWVYGQAGLLYMGKGNVLSSIQKNWAAYGNAGIKFQPWEPIELKAQLDFHTAFYDSTLEFLGEVVQLTFGGSYLLNKQHKIDFAVVEDIKNGASPDVNFNISWWVSY